MDAFTIENLSFTYPEQGKKALDGVSLSVRACEFLLLCGSSGCGKSTLLRNLKSALTPQGITQGNVYFFETPLPQVDQRTQSAGIGFVMQNPESQIVTDKVWHELAFGLESLGYDTQTIRRRVAEMASFFGMESWFYQDVSALSGGQKQLLNLASVMTMQPRVLILDEPTAQLDPIAASDFLSALAKINRELGTAIILAEHRLEEAFPLADTVVVMHEGKLLCTGTPQEVGLQLKERGHGMFFAMPTAMRVWAATDDTSSCPITVCDGRHWLNAYAQKHPLHSLPPEAEQGFSEETVLRVQENFFRYEKNAPDVVKNLSLTVQKGTLFALLGGNGTGKTTSLKLFAGILRPYRGEIEINGRVGVLPQDPQTLFLKSTVREDLRSVLPKRSDQEEKLSSVLSFCSLQALADRHPYDLSGGEQQRAALAKLLLLDPEILLLDEPTKGFDAEFKLRFAQLLKQLQARGVTIIMVSHDVEFCATYADRCALFFDGNIVTESTPRRFFSGNSFYTTAANRMARDLALEAVTAEELIHVCGGTESAPVTPTAPTEKAPLPPAAQEKKKLPLWRKLLASFSGAIALATLLLAAKGNRIGALLGLSLDRRLYLILCVILVLSLLVLVFSVGKRSSPQTPIACKKQLSPRARFSAFFILLLIPLTLYLGVILLHSRSYNLISLLILLEAMLPFFVIFEGRKPKARDLVIIAVLCALGVAGRAAFFMLPQFKPVMALTILAGVALGGESGFLVGAITMLISNMLFSQGPTTPWQMFSMGLVGFLAGVLFRRGRLAPGKIALSVFGVLSAILIYGGIMNTSSALLWLDRINKKILISYWISGLPFDCVHAAATAFFLWVAAEPFLEKLERIKLKYGITGI